MYKSIVMIRKIQFTSELEDSTIVCICLKFKAFKQIDSLSWILNMHCGGVGILLVHTNQYRVGFFCILFFQPWLFPRSDLWSYQSLSCYHRSLSPFLRKKRACFLHPLSPSLLSYVCNSLHSTSSSPPLRRYVHDLHVGFFSLLSLSLMPNIIIPLISQLDALFHRIFHFQLAFSFFLIDRLIILFQMKIFLQ